MKHIAQALTAAALVFAIATPALAAKPAMSAAARQEMQMKQKTCKTEASQQKFGVHVVKKRAFIKECMKRPA